MATTNPKKRVARAEPDAAPTPDQNPERITKTDRLIYTWLIYTWLLRL